MRADESDAEDPKASGAKARRPSRAETTGFDAAQIEAHVAAAQAVRAWLGGTLLWLARISDEDDAVAYMLAAKWYG